MFEIAIVKNIYYNEPITKIDCIINETQVIQTRLFEPFGMKFKIPINSKVLLYINNKEWVQSSDTIAFYTGAIDTMKITSNNVNVLKTISTYFDYNIQLMQYIIEGFTITLNSIGISIATLTTLGSSSILDAPTKTALLQQKANLTIEQTNLTTKINFMQQTKTQLETTKTEFNKTFFE